MKYYCNILYFFNEIYSLQKSQYKQRKRLPMNIETGKYREKKLIIQFQVDYEYYTLLAVK